MLPRRQAGRDVKNTLTAISGLYASATRDEKSGDMIVKVVKTSSTPTETAINLNGVGKLAGDAQAIVLSSDNQADENSLENPTKVSPKSESVQIPGPKFARTLSGNSLTILRISVSK